MKKAHEALRFVGCDAYQQAGYCATYADHGDLVPGTVYEVEEIDVQNWHTNIWLVGHGGPFNSVCFESVEVVEKEDKCTS